jgi:hypothetical protein
MPAFFYLTMAGGPLEMKKSSSALSVSDPFRVNPSRLCWVTHFNAAPNNMRVGIYLE